MAKPVERDSNDLRHEEAAVNRAYGWELILELVRPLRPTQESAADEEGQGRPVAPTW